MRPICTFLAAIKEPPAVRPNFGDLVKYLKIRKLNLDLNSHVGNAELLLPINF